MQHSYLSKKLILKILISVLLVGITVSSFIIVGCYNRSNQNKPTASSTQEVIPSTSKDITTPSSSKDDGLVSVSISLIDKNGNVVFDENYKLAKEDANKSGALYDLLCAHHTVRATDSIYGKTLFDIDSVKTKFYSESYISILVDGKYSNYGISGIVIYDGINVTFKEVAL